MRIRDWSSDGCSSDRATHGPCVLRNYLRGGMAEKVSRDRYVWRGADRTRSFAEFRLLRDLLKQDLPVPRPIAASYLREGPFYRASILMERLLRSEEHTSELQSLMRISYAVFCLKTKNKHNI